MTNQPQAAIRTSHGHEGSTTKWLDAHFEANRPEYETAIRIAGFEPGWNVLDAGCGVGNYVPLIAGIVGDTGKVTALDLEAENVAAVRERTGIWNLPCECEVLEGSALSLPLEDDSVDAVWCAHVMAYLDDDDSASAVREFRRVVRPGGIVVLKDLDLRMVTLGPDSAQFLWRLFEDWQHHEEWSYGKGALRTSWGLSAMLEDAGLAGVRQQSIPIERRQPLAGDQRSVIAQTMRLWAGFALELDLPDIERDWWRLWAGDQTATEMMDRPGFYWREGQVVARGRVTKQ